MKNIFLLLAGGAALYFLSRGKLGKSVTLSLEKIDGALKQGKLFITIGVANPTGISSSIKAITGALFISGKEVAKVTSFDAVRVAPRAKTNVRVTLTPTVTGIAQVIKNLVKTKMKGAGKIQSVFKGVVNIDGTAYPINSGI